MTSKTIASRGARAVIVILAAIALAGEASATSWKAIPVRDAVSKADAIVRGKVASVEPLDVNSDVVVVEVAAVLKGDMPKDATIGEMLKDATIRLVATHRGAKGVHRFREGEEGIWLATKLPDREAYAVSGHPVSFQPVAAARVIELLVAGTTDAGEEMPKLLREADARVRQLLLGDVSGPQARAASLPLLLEWAGAAQDRTEEIGVDVRGLVMQQLVNAAAEGGGDVSRRAMAVLDGVLAREPGKTESAVIFARAYEAAGTIARKQLGFTEEIATNVDYRAFYPPDGNPEAIRGSDPRAQAQAMREAMASNAKNMQPAALQHEQAMAGVKTLRAWWARAGRREARD